MSARGGAHPRLWAAVLEFSRRHATRVSSQGVRGLIVLTLIRDPTDAWWVTTKPWDGPGAEARRLLLPRRRCTAGQKEIEMPFFPVDALLALSGAKSNDLSDWAVRIGAKPPFDLSDHVGTALCAIVMYLVLLQLLRKNMETKEPSSVGTAMRVHNIFLGAFSGLMFVALLAEVAGVVRRFGVVGSWCDLQAYTPFLAAIYYHNYLAKYYELLDTVFLVLRKKPLTFLHVYHHSATLLLTAVQLSDRTTVQWVPILLNLGVHTVMYAYYAMRSFGYTPWWKRYLTGFQITQFVVDMAVCLYASWRYTQGVCDATLRSSVVGCAILGSYLLLFLRFYSNTYGARVRHDVKVE